MRTSIGIVAGLAVVGLFACATETIVKTNGGKPAESTDTDGTLGTPEATDPSTSGDPTSPDSPTPPLVSGLAVDEIAFLQGVKVSVVKEGKPVAASSRNAPVVANRPGLVRVFVTPGSGWSGRSVTAQLRLVDGTKRLPVLEDTKTITKASTDEDIESTFNFEVPATSLPKGVSYQVFLTAKDGAVTQTSTPNEARFPHAGGVQELGNEASGKLKLVIVPVKYDADGSGRVPDTSPGQLERYKQTFMAQYAAAEVEVTARAPWSWSSTISSNGSGFSQVLNGVTQLRKSDGAGDDVYYYGALAPTSSFNTFCGRGCVTGLSTVVENPKTSFLRASVGVGFSGQDSVNTAAHEVGHAHGRNHAPCGGAQGVDPDFPYSGGAIGTWGYNIFTKALISPTKGRDIMGYCPNEWVSDYTFTALFDRIAALNGNASTQATGVTNATSGSPGASSGAAAIKAAPQTFRMAMVGADGSLESGGEIELTEEPEGGILKTATFVSPSGATLGSRTAHFYPYDHLPGGVLVVPAGTGDVSLATWSHVKVSGLVNVLAR